jgi:CubicO group peptidase (beta-lactamase class C family)
MLTALCLGVLLFLQTPDSPVAATVDQTALERLVQRCRESRSWSLVVWCDGKEVLRRNFGVPNPGCNLMSATKSITSLAVGLLIDDGRIPSVDMPVQRFFPEYRGKWKEQVTIRHLLEHTSGIRLYADDPHGGEEVKALYRVRSALQAPVVKKPGTHFSYNNRAVDLLSGVVRRAAGMPLDKYIHQRLLRPLGIRDYFWMKDPDGNPHGCAELFLRPVDMAKIGQMMLDGGAWNGRRILSKQYVERATQASKISTASGRACGWLWWVCEPWFTLDEGFLDKLKRAGLSPAEVARVRPLLGQEWPNYRELILDFMNVIGPRSAQRLGLLDWADIAANMPDADWHAGFYANGWGGQWLLVLPKQRIVAVRTCGFGFQQTDEPAKFEMGDFFRLVRALRPRHP